MFDLEKLTEDPRHLPEDLRQVPWNMLLQLYREYTKGSTHGNTIRVVVTLVVPRGSPQLSKTSALPNIASRSFWPTKLLVLTGSL